LHSECSGDEATTSELSIFFVFALLRFIACCFEGSHSALTNCKQNGLCGSKLCSSICIHVANIRDSCLVVLHNGTTPHDNFHVDCESAATINDIIASGVLFHNCTMHHDRFRVVVIHNCTTSHDGFPLDLGSAATINDVIACNVLFQNCTKHHDRFLVDSSMYANNVMTTKQMDSECISEVRLV
jgi:hypothetical protein